MEMLRRYFVKISERFGVNMWGILIAIISGALMSTQGVFNTGVTKQTGIWVSASFVQFTALIVCLGAWVITGRQSSFGELFKIDGKYMLLGGVLGAFITYTVIKSVDTLGPARANMFIITAQLIVAYMFEVFGLCGTDKVPFEWRKLVGMLLVIAGIITFKWER
jgi:bacterial/archaeal transporter family-2 protein